MGSPEGISHDGCGYMNMGSWFEPRTHNQCGSLHRLPFSFKRVFTNQHKAAPNFGAGYRKYT